MSDETGSEQEVRGYRVEGRVQGVGFRWWTRKTATSLALRGRVRNLADGAVEVRAAGPADALSTLEMELRRGPGPAKVTSVEPVEVGDGVREAAAGWTSFEIDRA